MSVFQPRHGSLDRYRQVVQIFFRHGFHHYVVDQLGLGHLLPFRWSIGRRGREAPQYTDAQHLRMALEELGTTFIKLGQILSTRSDLLPPEYIAELSRLQDAVPPEPPGVIEDQITQELGATPEGLFTGFDSTPLGSASIGQVHAARLRSGEEVVVKVRRPGVEQLVEQDLAILMDLARLAYARTVWGKEYNVPAIAEEFAETLRAELDFVREGRNAETIARNFPNDPVLRIPAIYWRFTTKRVLTMERITGIKVNDVEGLDKAGIDRLELGKDGLRIILKMILEDGFFHADPHPGNFLIRPGPVIGLMDFGMVGSLDRQTRENLLYLLLAVVDRDAERVLDHLSALGVVGTTARFGDLQRDINHLISLYWDLPLQEIDVHRVIEEFQTMVRRHHLYLPSHLGLLFKTINMHEGLARQLDPKATMADVLPGYARQLILRGFLPQQWSKRLFPALLDFSQLTVGFPRRAHRILGQMERGTLLVNIRVEEMEHALDTVNRMVNRTIMAILTAGATVGIALMLQVLHMVELNTLLRRTLSLILGAGFLAAVALSLWLTVGILRRGHH